jgi:hypothetical protein
MLKLLSFGVLSVVEVLVMVMWVYGRRAKRGTAGYQAVRSRFRGPRFQIQPQTIQPLAQMSLRETRLLEPEAGSGNCSYTTCTATYPQPR